MVACAPATQSRQNLVARGRLIGWRVLAALVLCTLPTAAAAPLRSVGAAPLTTAGQPEVSLDRLDFPANFLGAERFKKHLVQTLRREVRAADWGAGSANRIEYRYAVTELRFTLDEGVLQIHCSAVGRLPGGQTAKSDLSFGGAPAERDVLLKKVLDIVAEGVITRLAELERRRRGLR